MCISKQTKFRSCRWQALATCQAHSICLLRSFTELKEVQLILHFADDKSEVWGSQLSNLTSALRFGLIQQDHRVKWQFLHIVQVASATSQHVGRHSTTIG